MFVREHDLSLHVFIVIRTTHIIILLKYQIFAHRLGQPKPQPKRGFVVNLLGGHPLEACR